MSLSLAIEDLVVVFFVILVVAINSNTRKRLDKATMRDLSSLFLFSILKTLDLLSQLNVDVKLFKLYFLLVLDIIVAFSIVKYF